MTSLKDRDTYLIIKSSTQKNLRKQLCQYSQRNQ